MAEQADEDTAVPGLATTEQAELAWSAADDADDLYLPGSWRPVCRSALEVSRRVAVAGMITVVDRHAGIWPRVT